MAAGLTLLVAGFYAEEGVASASFWLVTMLAVGAVALPRPLRLTTRTAVWGWVLCLVIFLAANIDRVVPGRTSEPGYLFFYDRIALGAFAGSVLWLFFRSGRLGSAIIVGGMVPMFILSLVRLPEGTDPSGWIWTLLVGWVCFFQLVDASGAATEEVHRREWLTRLVAIGFSFALAFAIVKPVSFGVEKSILHFLAQLNHPLSASWARGNGSRLGLDSPPLGWGSDTRPFLTVRSREMPGYLRERVYTRYVGGAWLCGEETKAVRLVPRHEPEGYLSFAFPGGTADFPATTTNQWLFSILRPWQVPSICLPGGARDLTVEDIGDPGFFLHGTGLLTPDSDRIPQQYSASVPFRGGLMAWPDGTPAPDCLAVPPALGTSVSNWMADAHLTTGQGTAAAISGIMDYFAHSFTYRLGVQAKSDEPLADFMAQREGHCTLFASAAALMLRGAGIPTRVVGGYYCSERHPWTGEWVVRGRDGHAWCEAYDRAAARWVLVDATPPGGLPDFGRPGLWRLATESVGWMWRRFQQTVTEHNPLVWVALGGEWLAKHSWTFARSVWSIPVWFAAGWFLVRWHRHRQHLAAADHRRQALLAAMRRFERSVAKGPQRRRIDETWSEWATRLAPQLPPDRARMLHKKLYRYEQARYRNVRGREADGLHSQR